MEIAGLFLRYGRLAWLALAGVWFGLAATSEAISLVASTWISAVVFAVAVAGVWLQETQWGLIHGVAGIFHGGSALGLSVAALANGSTWRAPLTRIVSSWKPANGTTLDCASSPCYLDSFIRLINDAELPLIDFVVFAALVSSSYHSAIALYPPEATEIEKGTSGARWRDYSLSASAILVVIASLSGIADVFLLLTVALIEFVLLSVAESVEFGFRKRDPQAQWDFSLLFVAFAIGWIPIMYAFGTSFEENPKPPTEIIAIIAVLFGLYLSFVVIFIAAPYWSITTTEIAYITLSFISKTALHWLLWSGIQGRDDRVFTTRQEALKHFNTTGTTAIPPETLAAATVVPFLVGCGFGVWAWRLVQTPPTTPGESTKKLLSKF